MEAKQFVYTNVEEKDSPHRRRGYQSWLFPQDLAEDQRRQIEGHLNQLDWETPEEPAERHLSHPLPDGSHLIACSRSLSCTDRFDRSGRFHAHGLILSEKDFEKIHCDPFRVIDAVAFQSDPTKEIDGWGREKWEGIKSKKELEQLKFEPYAPRPTAAAPPEVIGWLVELVRSAEKKPSPRGAVVQFLAVPLPPADVLAYARAVLHALPPKFRKVVSFDTLRPLRHPHTAHLSGALSPDWLGRWRTASRYTVVEPGKPLTLPQPPSPWRELCETWATMPQLGVIDRESSRVLAKWLDSASSTRSPDPARLTDAGIQLVRQLCAPEKTWQARVEELATRAVVGLPKPAVPFVRQAVAEHVGEWSLQGFQRLHTGVTDELVGRCLVNYFEANAQEPLRGDAITALNSWLRSRSAHLFAVNQLAHVTYRWHSLPNILDRAVQTINNPSTDEALRKWFHEWCQKSLPEDACATKGLRRLVEVLLTTPAPENLSELVRQARLGRAIHALKDRELQASGTEPGKNSRIADVRADLAVAVHDPSKGDELEPLLNALTAEGKDVASWLLKFAREEWKARARLAVLADDERLPRAEEVHAPAPYGTLPFYLGVEIDCPATGAARAELARTVFSQPPGVHFLRTERLLPHKEATPLDFPDSKSRSKLRAGKIWRAVTKAQEDRDVDKLTELFTDHPDVFCLAANQFLFHEVQAKPVCFARTAVRGSIFVGFMPEVHKSSGHLTPLIRGLLRSVIPVRRVDDPAAPPLPYPDCEPHLRWLIDCLETPPLTEEELPEPPPGFRT